MPSTVIRRFDYRPDRCELFIEFRSGKRYIYSNVPESVAHAFGAAFGKGIYYNSRIRDRFPSRELTGAGQDG